jgi:hypothetical protein
MPWPFVQMLVGRWRSVVGASALALGAGLIVATAILYYSQAAGNLGGDARTYLAAGERLNAGHPLYSLSPGDRPVAISPPWWTAPLVSPPFIAVLWRPLAALPGELGLAIWIIGSVACVVVTAMWLHRRHPLGTGVALAALSVPIGMEIVLGNVNGYLLAGLVAVWALRQWPWSGAILGLMIAIKLWPVALAVWLLGQRRWATLRWTAASLAFCGALSLLGAGWANHIAYLSVGASVHPSAFSLTSQLGLPWLWVACLGGGLVLTAALRSRADWSYRAAIATIVLGTPIVNPNTYALLLAALAA